MIYHPCYSIIHKSIFFSPSFQVLYLRSKRNVERIYKINTKYICDLFPFVIFKREILTWMFTEQRSPFLIPIGEMDFFSLELLFCAVLLVTVL